MHVTDLSGEMVYAQHDIHKEFTQYYRELMGDPI